MVHFKKVSHSYATNHGHAQTTLINFTGDFFSGEKVVITGDSGSGKTTLLKLVQGHINPTQGKVTIHHPHQKWALFRRKWAERIPYFSSDWTHEPHWTVRDLIKMFQLTISDIEKIGFSRLQISQRLSDLSGGEKVRIWLCCLMKQPSPILLLDEPTQALDDMHVGIILAMIRRYPGLVIIASHDKRIIELADKHFHLDKLHQLNVITTKPIVANIPIRYRRPRYKLKLFYRLGWRDSHLRWTSASQLLSLTALCVMTITNLFRGYYQSHLNELYQRDTWMMIREKVVTPLAQSPFNLVEYRLPKIEDVQKTFSLLYPLTIDINYLELFPKVLTFENVIYDVHIANLPLHEGRLSMVVVGDSFSMNQDYHWQFPLYNRDGLHIDTLQERWPLAVQFVKRLTVLEAPRLYLSYQQLKTLATNSTLLHPFFEGMTLDSYLKTYPQEVSLLIDTQAPRKKAMLEKLGSSLSQYDLVAQTHMLAQTRDTWLNFVHWLSVFFALTAMLFLKFNHSIFVCEIIEKKHDLIKTYRDVGLQPRQIKLLVLIPMHQIKIVIWISILIMAIMIKNTLLPLQIFPTIIFYFSFYLLWVFDWISDKLITLIKAK